VINSSERFTSKQPKIFLILCLISVVVMLGFVGVYASQASDPYTRQVLALEGNPVQGNAIFQINCAGCHGAKADGNVGPSLWAVGQRKSDSRLIQQVISGKTPPMPKFQPAPQEMADLLSYLQSL
jgi:mono/diheme cytochrome c family protein